MVIATLNLLDGASNKRLCHLIRQASPDTFPVQGKVSCVAFIFRIRSIDYIKYNLINCRIGYYTPSRRFLWVFNRQKRAYYIRGGGGMRDDRYAVLIGFLTGLGAVAAFALAVILVFFC